VLTAALASCTPAPAPEELLTAADLTDVVATSDRVDHLTFTRTTVTSTVEADESSLLANWEEGSGAPDDCLGAFLLPLLQRPDDPGHHDATGELGYFAAPDVEGRVVVNTRVFDDVPAARAFLDDALAIATDCTDGYTLFENPVAPDGFAAGPLAGLPGSVEAVLVDGGQVPGGTALRTIYLRRANVVIALHAELHEAEDVVDIATIDDLVATLADRMATL
jgi:hypothetical protein